MLNSSLEGSKDEDIGFLDDETLIELKRLVKVSLNTRGDMAEALKLTQNCENSLKGKALSENGDSRCVCCFLKTKPRTSVVASKCGSCGGVTC